MSDASRSFAAPTERDKVGPDYFSFYTREVAELLSQDDSSLLFSSQPSESSEKICREARGMVKSEGSYSCKEANSCPSYLPLFSNGFGASVSDFRQEKLKALLRQSLVVLTQEVDEMLDPVIAMQNLLSQLRRKRCLSSVSGAASDGDAGQLPQKKQKVSSPLSSISIPVNSSSIVSESCKEVSGFKGTDSKLQDITLSDKAITSDVNKYCDHCQTTETDQWRTGPKGPKSLCNSCGMKYEHGTESLLGSKQGDEKENSEVDDDLQYLLNNDSIYVDEMVNKYSGEYFSTLEHMEQQLEELLDAVVTKCRLMTLGEKQQLRKLIQKLPPKNLDRVVEIIQSKKQPSETKCHHEIYVDLEKADNVTLWRLYYYVEAVENASKLAQLQPSYQ